MPGGTESNGTGVGELPSLVLGIATRYRIFFRFGVGSDIGEFSSLVLGTACCALGTDIGEFALAVLVLLFRRPLAATSLLAEVVLAEVEVVQ